jgi:TfoX/Sxy family transcriptional regulator of competence genes
MAQDKAFVAEITEMLTPLDVRSRPMFGSYGMYCDDKFMAIISDGQLFLKQSEADPELFFGTEMAPPYPGAKDYHLVTADMFGDGEWLRTAVQATADALPAPKPKKAKGRE